MSLACAAPRILIDAKDRREGDFILSGKLHMLLK